MRLAGYDFEGPFTNLDDVKELPGVYIILSLSVLDVGESGWGRQGVNKCLCRHKRKSCWDQYRGTGNVAFAVLYKPNGDKRLKIEEALRQHYDPPCGTLPVLWGTL